MTHTRFHGTSETEDQTEQHRAVNCDLQNCPIVKEPSAKAMGSTEHLGKGQHICPVVTSIFLQSQSKPWLRSRDVLSILAKASTPVT